MMQNLCIPDDEPQARHLRITGGSQSAHHWRGPCAICRWTNQDAVSHLFEVRSREYNTPAALASSPPG